MLRPPPGKKSVMDGFEMIAIEQWNENLQFFDLYRMVEGKLTYQELSEVAPHFSDIQSVLDGVGIPTFLRHYDIVGTILKGMTGILTQMQDKFHVTDTGEIAESEFLRYKNDKIREMLSQVIQNSIDIRLAQAGYDKDKNDFSSPEEQQQYIDQLREAQKSFSPKDTIDSTKKTFKTIGIRWGEGTLDRDKERFDIPFLDKENFKDFFTSGRCFRHFRVGYDDYKPEVWSARTVFFSKEVDAKLVHKGEYVGNLSYLTPSQVIRTHGHLIPTDTQKKILGGNPDWKSYTSGGYATGSIDEAINSNFNKQARVPFSGYHDYNMYLGLQEETGIPLGVQTLFNDDGTTTTRDRFLPRMAGDIQGSSYGLHAKMLRDEFDHRDDLCMVTEVYFRAYDLYGYLTYPDDYGTMVTEEVTEDILPQFLKDNNIKQTYKESFVDIINEFEPNTLKWVYRPYVYKGIKIQCDMLTEPLYLQCEKWEHQIKGDSEFDVFLPVSGFISESIAKKIEPYQAQYNLCMNQVYSLLEKEIGIFFLMDVGMIPSQYAEWGDAGDAFMAMRNIAKQTGILPSASSPDRQGNNTPHNHIAAYDLSNTSQISNRVKMAEFTQNKAYEAVGMNRSILGQPTTYETAEGVKQSQEAGYAQLSEIYNDYNLFLKSSKELHLSVAQYAQSNNKDLSLYYTKSDGSIEFLKESDPDFPLRRLGLIATMDSGKRKELEQFKSYILSTNTLATDTIEIAKLISSDAMVEAVEIARNSQQRREEREDAIRAQQQASQEQTIKAQKEIADAQIKSQENEREMDRRAKILIAEINALGRAADKESNEYGFRNIKEASDQALKQNQFNFDKDMAVDKMKMEDKKMTDQRDIRMKELALKARELDERSKDRQSKEYVAAINKN
jgi:hypothetical protein